jgi:hypothetical protein
MFKVGDKVKHPDYGEGVVYNTDGSLFSIPDIAKNYPVCVEFSNSYRNGFTPDGREYVNRNPVLILMEDDTDEKQSFDEYKIRVATEDENRAVQEHAFKLGYRWRISGQYTWARYLFFSSDGFIRYVDEYDREFFTTHMYPQITSQEFLALPVPGQERQSSPTRNLRKYDHEEERGIIKRRLETYSGKLRDL